MNIIVSIQIVEYLEVHLIIHQILELLIEGVTTIRSRNKIIEIGNFNCRIFKKTRIWILIFAILENEV